MRDWSHKHSCLLQPATVVSSIGENKRDPTGDYAGESPSPEHRERSNRDIHRLRPGNVTSFRFADKNVLLEPSVTELIVTPFAPGKLPAARGREGWPRASSAPASRPK